MLLTSLGMYIIDDNKYHPSLNKPSQLNILGGGAAYTIVGARIIAGPKRAHLLCSIFDKGSDYPEEIGPILDSWGTNIRFREDPSRLTNRGVNYYDENDIRHFSHTAPKKRIDVDDVLESGQFRNAAAFHMCCAVQRCDVSVDRLNEGREPALYIFEPNPSDCTPGNMEDLKRVIGKIDVFSPNLDEACAFLGWPKTNCKTVAREFAQYLRKPNSGVLIRCGPDGCCYCTIDGEESSLPAYHSSQSMVVDVTGGGNSFCGAMVTGLVLTGSWIVAAICGNLASGAVIERLGVPLVEDGTIWNGVSVSERWTRYRESLDIGKDVEEQVNKLIDK